MRCALLLLLCSCMPPSVKAVDEWLLAYGSGDVEATVSRTWSGDQELVKAALAQQKTEPNGSTAMMLPPKPLSHVIDEIESKEDDRHVIIAKVTMKNPLPFASEKTGNALPDIPKTRTEIRKFLAIREGDRWGVKLDLERVKARAEFASRFFDRLGAKDLDAARAMLREIPPPPDDPNSLRKDRMVEELGKELAKTSSASR